jgi:hypothetical protein
VEFAAGFVAGEGGGGSYVRDVSLFGNRTVGEGGEVCVCVCVFVCLCVCVRTYVHSYTYVHTYIHIHIHISYTNRARSWTLSNNKETY